MKARRTSRCTPCGKGIRAGDEISAFLGKWAHATCKAADIARRARAAGPVIDLPDEGLDNETITYVGARTASRRGQVFLKSQRRA